MLGPFVPKVLTVCHLEQEPVNENESGVYVGENQRRCAAGRVEVNVVVLERLDWAMPCCMPSPMESQTRVAIKFPIILMT